ncbi:MAG TPA: RNA-binding protein [Candidatus Saccharimonadales bacterium]|jgi:cold-inducible RNA-binding protein|nr:RNA-binding protein [Candidatus Saccharimonadales bacterium]
MQSKLFVGNLSWEVTAEDLKALFAGAGTVVDAAVISDKMTGRSRGFGFVTMSSDEEAKKSIEMFNQADLKGRKINVNIARPMEPRQ